MRGRVKLRREEDGYNEAGFDREQECRQNKTENTKEQ